VINDLPSPPTADQFHEFREPKYRRMLSECQRESAGIQLTEAVQVSTAALGSILYNIENKG